MFSVLVNPAFLLNKALVFRSLHNWRKTIVVRSINKLSISLNHKNRMQKVIGGSENYLMSLQRRFVKKKLL